MAKQEKFIQVGVTALRDPATGEFLPAVRFTSRRRMARKNSKKS